MVVQILVLHPSHHFGLAIGMVLGLIAPLWLWVALGSTTQLLARQSQGLVSCLSSLFGTTGVCWVALSERYPISRQQQLAALC
jgi:hypothetical protein